jgi:competence protein ComEC
MERPLTFAVWNVGQGSAATLMNESACLHIDMGGENFPQQLALACGKKNNLLFITHYDWDHINLVKIGKKRLSNLCLIHKPTAAISARKHRLLDSLPHCSQTPGNVDQVGFSNFKVNNESNSYLIEDTLLITGDAPQKQEAAVLRNLGVKKERVQILLLGHHGSRTSTGKPLLQQLSHLRLAIASARKKRYGHPHEEVIRRLHDAAVPWISTEGYGDIFIELHN